MFEITSEMLRTLWALQGHEQVGGLWLTFIKEFEKLRDQHRDESIHFIPSTDDFNSREREDILRGIVICLDVISHAFSDPLKLLEEIKIIEQQTEINKDQNPF